MFGTNASETHSAKTGEIVAVVGSCHVAAGAASDTGIAPVTAIVGKLDRAR